MTALKAEAKSVEIESHYYDEYGDGRDSFDVEEGETFDIGDLVYVNENGKIKYFENISGEKYTSSNPEVAAVSGNNGTVNTKKAGTATIRVTYKGAFFEYEITVIEKGKLGATSRECDYLGRKADIVINAYGRGITSKNCYKVQQALNDLETACYASGLGSTGFSSEDEGISYDLLVPELLKTSTLETKTRDYIKNNNPIGRVKKKWFKVKSVTGKGKKVTVTLKNKVTHMQIFAIKASINDDTRISTGRKAVFPVYLKDSAGHYYRGRAVATEGSKKITATMNYMTMKKNKKYYLVGSYDIDYTSYCDRSWTGNKSFKAK